MSASQSAMFPIDAIDLKGEYYTMTFGADDEGNIWVEGQTHWVGFDEKDDRIELRELSLVDAERIAAIWKGFQEPFGVVNTDREWGDWFLAGGHALIKPNILKAHMPWELEPRKCVIEGRGPLSSLKTLPKTAFNRAPTPKLRMNVVQRDNYRCVLCGRRASDHVDVEIHVHHIRPFGQRGLTTAANLITLCHTCHKGLNPHYNWNLYDRIDRLTEGGDSVKNKHRDAYLKSVERYRKALAEDLQKFVTKSAPFDKIR